jgi:hypothetical protein
MRRLLAVTVVVMATALGALAPAAQAHHIDRTQSKVSCALVNGVPTIQVHAAYRQFEWWNTPAYWETYIDQAKVDNGTTPKFSPDYNFDKPYTTTSGSHYVYWATSWPQGADHVDGWVSCPAPPPPPVDCNGVQYPPGSTCPPPPQPPVVCNGVSYPAGYVCPPPPPPTCKEKCTPPPKKCVPVKLHLTVRPLRRLHGEVVFPVTGVKRSQVKHVTWSVRRPGHAWHRVGTSGRPWEHLSRNGLSWHIYLWVESVWGYPQWGKHYVKATVRVKTKCGERKVVKVLEYKNEDPVPQAVARRWE